MKHHEGLTFKALSSGLFEEVLFAAVVWDVKTCFMDMPKLVDLEPLDFLKSHFVQVLERGQPDLTAKLRLGQIVGVLRRGSVRMHY